uniref:Rap-GAP domain-containing protein n=1 Tax=Panagrellus redivivus TaxID=6233 RepID=A0A7E4VET8_PANRE
MNHSPHLMSSPVGTHRSRTDSTSTALPIGSVPNDNQFMLDDDANAFNTSRQFYNWFFRYREGSASSPATAPVVHAPDVGGINPELLRNLNPGCPEAVRVEAMKQLTTVVKQSTFSPVVLDTLYRETENMLRVEALKPLFIELMTEICTVHNRRLSPELRGAMLEQIAKLGLHNNVFSWLAALTQNGQACTELQDTLSPMFVRYFQLFDKKGENTLEPQVIALVARFLQAHAVFIAPNDLQLMITFLCRRVLKSVVTAMRPALSALKTITTAAILPQSVLAIVVSTMAILSNQKMYYADAWDVVRNMFAAHCGFDALAVLRAIMANRLPSDLMAEMPLHTWLAMCRGAVFLYTMVFWGPDRILTIELPLSTQIPHLEAAIEVHPTVCMEVIQSLAIIVVKHGSSFDVVGWDALLGLLGRICKMKEVVDDDKTVAKVKVVMSKIEQLHSQKLFRGSSERLYNLVEATAFLQSEDALLGLLDYRFDSIVPLNTAFVTQMRTFLERYYDHDNVRVSLKATRLVVKCYRKYARLFEAHLTRDLICVFLDKFPQQPNPEIRLGLVNLLVEVLQNVKIAVDADNSLFYDVLKRVDDIFNKHINLLLTCDGCETLALGIVSLLNKRFLLFDTKVLNKVVSLLVDHVNRQYDKQYNEKEGSYARAHVLTDLLMLHCNAISGQVVKVSFDEHNASVVRCTTNPRILRAPRDRIDAFNWESICLLVTRVLQYDLWWPVIRSVLISLYRALEHRTLVYTVDRALINNLMAAILQLNQRIQAGQLQHLNEDEVPRVYCPVLAITVNYCRSALRCQYLVEFVSKQSPEAIIGCDIAITVMPLAMTVYNRQLMSALSALPPNAKLAIPVIEMIGDSADAVQFHDFLEVEHHKLVMDVLVPYFSPNFNPYILLSIARVVMRWFVQVPESLREAVADYIVEKFCTRRPRFDEPRRSIDASGSVASLNHVQSTDRLSVMSNSTITTTDAQSTQCDAKTVDSVSIPPESPLKKSLVEAPPQREWLIYKTSQMQAEEYAYRNQVHVDAADVLRAFIVSYHKKPGSSLPDSDHLDEIDPKTRGLVPISSEHWYHEASIVSLNVYSSCAPTIGGADELSTRFSRTSINPAIPINPDAPPRPEFIGEIDIPASLPVAIAEPPHLHASRMLSSSMSTVPVSPIRDCESPIFTENDTLPTRRVAPETTPTSEWVQVVIRHVYGKQSWTMRAGDQIFNLGSNAAAYADPSSLLMHIRSNRNSRKLDSKHVATKLDDEIALLDSISTEETNIVGVLYMDEFQSCCDEFYANNYGSERYSGFIKNLGRVISLVNKPGGLQKDKDGIYTYEHVDAVSRTVFQVATLMPPNRERRQMLLEKNPIMIVFNETGKGYNTLTEKRRADKVVIEVIPIDKETVSVKLHADPDVAYWISLSSVVLPDAEAIAIIRKLVLRVQRSIEVHKFETARASGTSHQSTNCLSLAIERLHCIRRLATKFSSFPLNPSSSMMTIA